MFEDDTTEIPEGLKFILEIFTNLGGVLNLIVYLAVFRKTRSMPNMATSMEPRKTHTVSDNN
ncbi:hypothetical protein MAR_031038 [Mya arenaria]|uniref:Uncharacterized protein n=1 Tax=Mya arenaria TaxID=6604 RepID=A0ABY7F6L6_MYAAR|nr:hypothetical protein MAR_031038 [Mya arenaria]